CIYRHDTPENKAWHDGVYECWERIKIVKKELEQKLDALAEPAQEFEPVCEDCDTESRCHGAGNCPGKPSQPQAICGQPDRNARVLEICTDNSFIYYGPYKCEGCGRMICKLAREQGGDAFDYPEGPIYPNTNWVLHVCPQPQGKE